jgi:hypothetical protein
MNKAEENKFCYDELGADWRRRYNKRIRQEEAMFMNNYSRKTTSGAEDKDADYRPIKNKEEDILC